MDEDERAQLAEIAWENINTGYWQGCRTSDGGYEDGQPWSEEERAWRDSARDYVERWTAGDRMLTEGVIRYALWDLCRELAWLRGWCPEILGNLPHFEYPPRECSSKERCRKCRN